MLHPRKFALLFVFVFPLVGSFPSRRIQQNKLYGTFQIRQKAISKIALEGRFSEAIPLYRTAADQAKASGYPEFSRKFLNNLGACQLATFHYGAALQSLLEARALAEDARDNADRSALDLNISSLYLQMGNLSEAATAAAEGLAVYGGRSDYRAKLLIVLANVRTKMGQTGVAAKLFTEGIDAALEAGDNTTAAWGWDYLGFAYRRAGRLNDAEQASTEGFRLRKLLRLSGIESSYWNLGMIRAERGDSHVALILLNDAVQALSLNGAATPAWSIYGDRGKVQLRAGNLRAALADLRTAVSIAREWRIDLVPNDANRTSAESGLAELYGPLIEAGNRLYLKTHDPRLAQETFEAAEENRAASLRALLPQPHDWRNRLPSRYWETLVLLQTAERAVLQEGGGPSKATVAYLHAMLSEMEASAGSTAAPNSSTALERTKFNLDAGSVLFSFYLDDSTSCVWAVTRGRFTLHMLPPRKELAVAVRKFEQDILQGSPEMEKGGVLLYKALFGSIETEFLVKARWLLALDRDLFILPFAALNPEPGVFLAERHALQNTSGALLLQQASKAKDFMGPFLAVGDPIYNHVDSRFIELSSRAMRGGYGPNFARLWGSRREVNVSAEKWGATKSVILVGANASKARFWASTAEHPSVIHLATHILEEEERQNTGWIVLSLGADGDAEYLTPPEIAAHSVSARLVVLSGCSSGRAEVRSASGLMGLTRAWIAAGAGSVLATRWPIVDDNGEFFGVFYACLRENPGAGPATALQAASVAMMKSRTWRAGPGFWGTFFLVGNF